MIWQRALRFTIYCAAAGSLLWGCGTEDDATEEEGTVTEAGVDESDVRTAVPDMNTLLVDLPSAISATSSSSGSLYLAEEEGGFADLFLMPRSFIGLADEMNGFVREISNHLFGKPACRDDDASNDPDDCSEYMGVVQGAISETPVIFDIPDDPDDAQSPSVLKYYKNPAGSDYDYTFELYWQNSSDSLYYKGIVMNVTKVAEDKAKGQTVFFTSVMPEEEGDEGGPGTVVSTFDNTGDATEISLRLYGMDRSSDESNPERLGLSLSVDANEMLSGSGAMIRPEMNADQGSMAPFETKEGMAFLFKLAANGNDNVGIQSMAFPQEANFSDTDNFYSDYGVDDIMENFALGFLRSQSDDWDCSAYGTIFSLPANICDSNTDVTDAQVLNGIQNTCDGNSDPDMASLCDSPVAQTSRWANPLYLNENGYVGTASYNKPTDASYDGLADLLDSVTTIAPSDLSAESAPTAPEGVTAVE
jgi:hypothetical protein